MKRLPEKMMMAAIILSCGFVMSAEQPGAQRDKEKRATGADVQSWQIFRATEAAVPAVKPAKPYVEPVETVSR